VTLLDSLIQSNRSHVAKALHQALLRLEQGGPPPLALDCTAGNGRDTVFLAEAVGPCGLVLAFDIQPEALAATRRQLEQKGLLDRARLVQAGHETLAVHVPQPREAAIDAALFNLGFLPRSDRKTVTVPGTTLAALEALESRIRPGGICSAHCYLGHQGGAEEAREVEIWFRVLNQRNWRVLRLEFANKTRNREILFLAERSAGNERAAR
jgi:SAM-dependent methyltransferase